MHSLNKAISGTVHICVCVYKVCLVCVERGHIEIEAKKVIVAPARKPLSGFM